MPPMPSPAFRAFPRLVVSRFGGWTGWRRRGEEVAIPDGSGEVL